MEDYATVSSIEQSWSSSCHIVEGQTEPMTGSEVRVTVLRGGKSTNGYAYDEGALRSVARMIEGAKAYADHNTTVPNRSVRDMVGFYHDALYVAGAPSRVDATLHIMESASWLRSIVKEAMTLKRSELLGLSIDIYGNWESNRATGAKDVTQVLSLNSCDVVTKPSAGGAFQRILQGEIVPMEPTIQIPPNDADDGHGRPQGSPPNPPDNPQGASLHVAREPCSVADPRTATSA